MPMRGRAEFGLTHSSIKTTLAMTTETAARTMMMTKPLADRQTQMEPRMLNLLAPHHDRSSVLARFLKFYSNLVVSILQIGLLELFMMTIYRVPPKGLS